MEINNLLNQIGGWFGLGSKAQEKSFFASRIQMLGRSGAVYLDTWVPYRLYNEIPELNQVVDKKANMFSNGVFKLVTVDGEKDVKDPELMKLLENPNIFQSQNKWLKNYSIQLDIYGNQFIYKNKPSMISKYPLSLVNISASCLEPVLTGKVYDQVDLTGVIKKYEYKEGGTTKTFETKDIIWTKHDDLDNPVVGCSPLKSLKFPLTNTKLAYDYLNIISGEKGALGMLKTTAKDGAGALPVTPERKMQLENQYTNDYGVGDDKKSRIKFVDGGTEWVPMTYPTGQLLLLEQIDANKLTICDHFGLNINIFSSKNQTYENVKNALIQCYNDTIIPFADAFCQTLSKELGIDPKYKLILDYSHIGILQPDKLADANLLTTQLNSVNNAVASGLLTVQQAQAIYKNSFGLDFSK